jgi:group I intron endonuclease
MKTKVSGIYKIVNKVNGKYYVGSSKDINGRWKNHVSSCSRNCHKNPHLQNTWNKHGIDNFEFIVIEKRDESQLLIVEQKYLDKAKLEKNECYNMSFVAGRNVMSEEAKCRISEKNRLRWRNPEYKQLMSQHMKDRWTPEFREYMRETMRKSASGKYNGKENPMYGKHHSEESKRKMGGAVIDYRKERNPFYGKSHTPESIQKNRDAHLDTNIITFRNTKTGEVFVGIKSSFVEKYNLDRNSVYRLSTGKKQLYKNWTIVRS